MDLSRPTELEPPPPTVERQRLLRDGGWRTYAPIAFIILALAALALLPLLGDRYARPLHEQMSAVAEPGRSHVTTIQVALALEGSALHDYVEAGDPLFVERYREALERERSAHRELAPLVARMGSEAQRRYAEVRRLEREWHGRVERSLAGGDAARPSRDPLQEQLYEDLLLAAGRLDEAIAASAQESRSRILHAERVERWIAGALVLVALLAVGAVAWLGRRLRLYAQEAERQRFAMERAVDARARLMRGVSHDLKNPLGAIDGHAQLLEDGIKGPLSADQKESIARIRRAVRSVLSLIDDLLELSRAEAGQLPISPRSVKLDLVVRETAEEHRAAAVAAGHAFDVSVADELPPVVTDPERVRQVLGNLLSNAIKYTPSGGHVVVRVGMRARDAHAGRRMAVVDVSDTGPGIPREKVATIFDEFSRLDMHAAKPGAGLGLSIARRIAQLLGGDIGVRSEPGEGSTFTLWLPTDRRLPTERRSGTSAA